MSCRRSRSRTAPQRTGHRLALLTALVAGALGPCRVPAQTAPAAPLPEEARGDPLPLRVAPALQPPPRGQPGKKTPILLQADTLNGRPDLDTVAEGNADFRRDGVRIRADRLIYQQSDDLAIARGNVTITRDGDRYTGPELQLKVQSFEGFFLDPVYHFAKTGAGGSAERIDFLDADRAVATKATYTSCRVDGTGEPAWLLSTDKVTLDFASNEGIAEGAVMRFYGVPILAAPRFSFPLTDERKSGWLPPSIGLDTKSGLQLSAPYYWNIAPNRDATITPEVATRRGVGADAEFRYLEPDLHGSVDLNLLPFDQLTNTTRYSLAAQHDQDFADRSRLELHALRVSDDDYWKDFSRDVLTQMPRLLASDFKFTRPFGDDWTSYARIQAWQVLQTADPTTRIDGPYQRLPQIGTRFAGRLGAGFEAGLETEFNRFSSPANATLISRDTGSRLHLLGSVSRPFAAPGWSVTPKLSFNAASYALDAPDAYGQKNPSRVIPTLSVDSRWVFERETKFFGRDVTQTLEPRLLYVNTPFHDQAGLPNFDSAPLDFNFDSIFSENSFSGVDRVADSHEVKAGLTTRVIDPRSGSEVARFGIAQRFLLRDQYVTPNTADPYAGVGAPLRQRVSNVALLGSTSLIPNWTLDATLQYSPETRRWARSIMGVRYSPGPYRTVNVTYRYTRGSSEQVELGWQWPIYGPTPLESSVKNGGSGASCGGSWYAVGRINYSTFDKRVIDSVVGFEYDAGCWIGRVVASRLSTGLSEATTRFALQIEFVGLSRLNLGSNPLQSLKDNIPGFRLLRDDHAPAQTTNAYD